MKIAPYVEKLNASPEFKQFAKKNKNAFMIAGFFVIDFETGKNIHQIDYYLPSEHKIAAFTLDNKVILQTMNTLNHKIPEKLDLETKTDLDALKGILQDEMKNRSITQDIKKIIAILQNIEGKKIWNLNCVLSGMDILKAHVEDESQTVLKMEKNSIMDYIQKMPTAQLQQLQKQQPQAGQAGQPQAQVQQSMEDAGEKIKKLNELEAEIEKEKAELQNQTKSKSAKTSKVAKAKVSKKK